MIARTEPIELAAVDAPIWPVLERAVPRPIPAGACCRRCSPAAPTAGTCAAPACRSYGFGVLSAALDPATYWSRFHGEDERIDLDSLGLSTAAWEDVARDYLS